MLCLLKDFMKHFKSKFCKPLNTFFSPRQSTGNDESNIWLGISFGFIGNLPSIENALAAGDEPGEYLDRRVEIWGLFYRLMIVAFTIGTVVSGTIVWLVLRFRESTPTAKPTEYEADGKW